MVLLSSSICGDLFLTCDGLHDRAGLCGTGALIWWSVFRRRTFSMAGNDSFFTSVRERERERERETAVWDEIVWERWILCLKESTIRPIPNLSMFNLWLRTKRYTANNCRLHDSKKNYQTASVVSLLLIPTRPTHTQTQPQYTHKSEQAQSHACTQHWIHHNYYFYPKAKCQIKSNQSRYKPVKDPNLMGRIGFITIRVEMCTTPLICWLILWLRLYGLPWLYFRSRTIEVAWLISSDGWNPLCLPVFGSS